MRTAHDEAVRLIEQAPDMAWLRTLTDELDRVVRQDPLERLTQLWGLSNAEAARLFGVSRQAFSKWLQAGVPSDRARAVADLAAATDVLDRRIKRERIPAVVRRPASLLGGRSLFDMACDGRHEEVRQAVSEMLDLRRVQP